MAKKSVYEIVTDNIIEKLEQGVVPWKMTWDPIKGSHRNISGRPYRGMNVFMLMATSAIEGYEHPIWMTYKQASERGGQVRKGEQSTMVTLWKPIEKKTINEETGEEETETNFFLRYYSVFNIAQVDGIEIPSADEIKITSAEELIEGYKDCPKITYGGSGAFYNPSSDYIGMPNKDAFDTPEDYYITLFHEMTHSTGHESRMNRKLSTSFGSEEYSKEELIAEMGASFMASMAGLEIKMDNQASYIDGWLKKLKSDKRMLVFAASSAQKAVDYMIKEE